MMCKECHKKEADIDSGTCSPECETISLTREQAMDIFTLKVKFEKYFDTLSKTKYALEKIERRLEKIESRSNKD